MPITKVLPTTLMAHLAPIGVRRQGRLGESPSAFAALPEASA
jgi:hypothetical protein